MRQALAATEVAAAGPVADAAVAGRIGLLVLLNGFVGAMIGAERATLPLIATRDFRQASATAALSFILAFGLAKVFGNVTAGRLADRIGRKRLLVLGWCIGLPAPLLIWSAPSWGWVVLANAFLGISQGLCWSMTVVMKLDLVSPRRRGLVVGLNEFAGYGSLALAAILSSELSRQYGLRGATAAVGFVAGLLGLTLSVFFVRESKPEEPLMRASSTAPRLIEVARATLLGNRTLSSASQAGLVTNLNDSAVWGLFPIFFAGAGLSGRQIAAVAALYPATWGLSQLATGALSDRAGRKTLIVAGMWGQAIALFTAAASGQLGLVSATYRVALVASVLLGVGTALVYPTLIAAVGDATPTEWRSSAVGVYRGTRDFGYVAGALVSGILADAFGPGLAIAAVGGLTFASGTFALARMPARKES